MGTTGAHTQESLLAEDGLRMVRRANPAEASTTATTRGLRPVHELDWRRPNRDGGQAPGCLRANKPTHAERRGHRNGPGKKVFLIHRGPQAAALPGTAYQPGLDPGPSTVASVTVTDTQECVDPAKSAGTEAA